jgi:hypothetical protein
MSKQSDLLNLTDAISVSGTNVGIGTTSPQAKLHIVSHANQEPMILQATTDGYSYITYKNSAGTDVAYTGLGGGAAVVTGTTADYAIRATANLLFGAGSSSERMRIDSIGAVTMPYQPAFLARPTGIQADIPASTTVTVVFGTEVFDQNSDFASNTFTAPVTGKYQLSYSLYLSTTIDIAAAYYEVELQTSNRSYSFVIDPNFASNLNYLTITQSALADMDAGDGAYVTIRQQTGTAQTDISTSSFFSGYLVA